VLLVDTALRTREEQGNPIRVAIVGAGFMSQGLANQIAHSTPGMRVVGIFNRRIGRALDVFHYAGYQDVAVAETQTQLDDAIRANKPVATENASFLARSELVDVVVDVTVERPTLTPLESPCAQPHEDVSESSFRG